MVAVIFEYTAVSKWVPNQSLKWASTNLKIICEFKTAIIKHQFIARVSAVIENNNYATVQVDGDLKGEYQEKL